jgi:hypothetical protein
MEHRGGDYKSEDLGRPSSTCGLGVGSFITNTTKH